MVTIDNPQDKLVKAIFLRGHLRLMAVGMNARGLTRTRALKLATEITGKKYRPGEHGKAAEDLSAFIKEHNV